MFRNPMQAILAFAENRGEDADILTTRLNQMFGPMAEQLLPAAAMTEQAGPPQAPVPAPFSPAAGLAAATMPNAVDTSQMMVLGEVTRGGQQMLMLRAPDGTVTYQPKDAMPSAQVGQAVSAAGGLSGGLPDFADFTPPAFAGGSADIDSTYRNVADALNVRVSSSGAMTSTERRDVESMFGAILNEVIDPESTVEANKRQGVADLFTGLGIGFGQMSRGDRVDLSEVRTAAAQRQREQTALRMERAKRAAGASYAMELGDEGLARAIAGGAADVNTLLSKRQQDIVNERANTQILMEAQRHGLLGAALRDAGASDSVVAAAEAGASIADLSKVMDMSRVADAANALEARVERDLPMAHELAAQAQAILRAQRLGEEIPDSPYNDILSDPTIFRGVLLESMNDFQSLRRGGSIIGDAGDATRSAGEARASAPQGADPIEIQANLAAANSTLANPNATQPEIDAAIASIRSGGTLSPADIRGRAAISAAPRDTSDIQNYEFYADQERAEGREPMTFEQFRQARPAGVSVNVNQPQPGTPAGVHPMYGAPPDGTVWANKYNADGSVMGSLNADGQFIPQLEMQEGPDGRMRPVAVPVVNSPAAEREAQRIAAAEASAAETAARQQRGRFLTQNINREVAEALTNLDRGMAAGLLSTSGLTGTLLALVPGTEAADLRNLLDSLQGASALEQLSMLKEATGAGLGNVTERQLDLLATAFGSLRQSSSPEMLRKNLANVSNIMTDITFGAGNPERLTENGGAFSPGADNLGLTPSTFRSYIQANDPALIVPLIEDFAKSRGVPPVLSDDAFQALPPSYQRAYLETVERLLAGE